MALSNQDTRMNEAAHRSVLWLASLGESLEMLRRVQMPCVVLFCYQLLRLTPLGETEILPS